MKKAANRIISLTLALVCLLAYIPQSHAAQLPSLPNELFLTQSVSGTCTLCSSAMMIRSIMYRHGNSNWPTVTESSLRSDAWVSGVGLRWSFSHTVGNTTVQVGHRNVSGMTLQGMKDILQEHPEGIVLYCGKLPHALLLTGFDGDILYCADTVKGISGRQVPLNQSWLGIKYGSQAAILKAVTAYWYVTDYIENGHSLTCACSDSYAGTYVATSTPTELRIRSGHGTSYSILGSIPYGAEVTVLEASGQTKDDWAHVVYNGIQGYSSMEYLEKIGKMGTVTIDVLNIRADAGTNYARVGQLQEGTRLQILEIKQVGDSQWGRIDKGWVLMDYVKLDSEETPIAMGTVTGLLNIRADTGTQYARLGQLQEGTRLEIFEIRQVGDSQWGRIDKGWVLMDYVKLDSEETPIAMGTVTGLLNIRADTGTQYARVGQLQEGTRLEIFEIRQVGDSQWGRIDKGWVLMDYVKLDGAETPTAMGTVTIDVLNVRADAGTQYAWVGQLKIGTRLEILEIKQVGDSQWGRISMGWVCMDYVKLDEAEPETITGTVNIYCLRVRSSAGTTASVVGYYYEGAQVEILETTVVNGETWGRTDKGWISMEYVS